jgi:hypothetical protein
VGNDFFCPLQTIKNLDYPVIAATQGHGTRFRDPFKGNKNGTTAAFSESRTKRDLRYILGTPFNGPKKN